jgi:hypothetical protein
MAKEKKVWYIIDKEGNYYRGRRSEEGLPVIDGCQREAMKMTHLDIKSDFPEGLPKGCKKVKALY